MRYEKRNGPNKKTLWMEIRPFFQRLGNISPAHDLQGSLLFSVIHDPVNVVAHLTIASFDMDREKGSLENVLVLQ